MATIQQIQALAEQRSQAVLAGDQQRAAEITQQLEAARQEFDTQQATQAQTEQERQQATQRIVREQERREQEDRPAPTPTEPTQPTVESLQFPTPPEEIRRLVEERAETTEQTVARISQATGETPEEVRARIEFDPTFTPSGAPPAPRAFEQAQRIRDAAARTDDPMEAQRLIEQAELLEARETGFTEESVRAIQEWRREQDLLEGFGIGEESARGLTASMVDSPGISTRPSTVDAAAQQRVFQQLDRFEADPGRYDITRALLAGATTPEELRAAGFQDADVQRAQQNAQAMRDLAAVGIISAPELLPQGVRTVLERRANELEAEVRDLQAQRDRVATGTSFAVAAQHRATIDRIIEPLANDAATIRQFLNDGVGIIPDARVHRVLGEVQQREAQLEGARRAAADIGPDDPIAQQHVQQLEAQLARRQADLTVAVEQAAQDPILNFQTNPTAEVFLRESARAPGETARRVGAEIAASLAAGTVLATAVVRTVRVVGGVARPAVRAVVQPVQRLTGAQRARAAENLRLAEQRVRLEQLLQMERDQAARVGQLVPTQVSPAEEAALVAGLRRTLSEAVVRDIQATGRMPVDRMTSALTARERAILAGMSTAAATRAFESALTPTAMPVETPVRPSPTPTREPEPFTPDPTRPGVEPDPDTAPGVTPLPPFLPDEDDPVPDIDPEPEPTPAPEPEPPPLDPARPDVRPPGWTPRTDPLPDPGERGVPEFPPLIDPDEDPFVTPQTEPEVDPEPTPEREPSREPEPVVVPAPDVDPDVAPGPEIAPDPDPDTFPTTDPTPEPAPDPTRPGEEPMPQPDPAPTTTTSPATSTEPFTGTAAEPATSPGGVLLPSTRPLPRTGLDTDPALSPALAPLPADQPAPRPRTVPRVTAEAAATPKPAEETKDEEEDEKKRRRRRWPLEVTKMQGTNRVTRNLLTGQQVWSSAPGSGSPYETIRVTKWSPVPVKPQTFSMGAFDVRIDNTGKISHHRREDQPRPKPMAARGAPSPAPSVRPDGFRMPNGEILPPNRYPLEAKWREGEQEVTYNFSTGKSNWENVPGSGRPHPTFRVTKWTDQPPLRTDKVMGVMHVSVTRAGLRFTRIRARDAAARKSEAKSTTATHEEARRHEADIAVPSGAVGRTASSDPTMRRKKQRKLPEGPQWGRQVKRNLGGGDVLMRLPSRKKKGQII